MPKGSPELVQARRDEIISACGKLYETMSFKDITIKEIANFTSFTRPSIYNYFQTKEEIFLALFQREYETWTEEVGGLMPSGRSDRRREFARALALTLEKRGRLLKLLSTNLSRTAGWKSWWSLRPPTALRSVRWETVCSGSARRQPKKNGKDLYVPFFPFSSESGLMRL